MSPTQNLSYIIVWIGLIHKQNLRSGGEWRFRDHICCSHVRTTLRFYKRSECWRNQVLFEWQTVGRCVAIKTRHTGFQIQSSLDPAPQSQSWRECFCCTLRKPPPLHGQFWLMSPRTSIHFLGQTCWPQEKLLHAPP